MHTWIDKL